MSAVLTTGAGGMSFEIVVLYLYQASFGVLYQKVSLLIASYMLGLAAGALLFRLRGRAGFGTLLFADACVAALLLFPVMWKYHSPSPLEFASALVLFGVAGGFQLAAAGFVLERLSETVAAAAGVEAADHIGAMAGAFATGLLLVPLAGVFCTALALVAVKLTSLCAVAGVCSRCRGA